MQAKLHPKDTTSGILFGKKTGYKSNMVSFRSVFNVYSHQTLPLTILPLNGNQLSWFNAPSQEDRTICPISQLFDSCISVHDGDPLGCKLISVLNVCLAAAKAFALGVKPVFPMAEQTPGIQDCANVIRTHIFQDWLLFCRKSEHRKIIFPNLISEDLFPCSVALHYLAIIYILSKRPELWLALI